MRILVTGGAGFIGSNFVTHSVTKRGEVDLTVLDSLTYAGAKENLSDVSEVVNFVAGDIRDDDLVSQLVQDCDLVVNFAAETHNDNSLRAPKIFYETNVMGTLNLAQACVLHGKRLHHISTDEVFGDLPLDSASQFTVDSPYKPSSPYSASKAASDQIVRAWIRSFNLQATISNCSNNFGPRQHREKLIPATISRLFAGEDALLYGDGRNVRDWIHVDDHVSGIWSVIDKGSIGETYLFGSRDEVDNITIVREILSVMQLPQKRIRFISDRKGHDLRYAIDPTVSENDLGWKPNRRSLLEELPELVDWYLNYNRSRING